jgi:hypothetical protein
VRRRVAAMEVVGKKGEGDVSVSVREEREEMRQERSEKKERREKREERRKREEERRVQVHFCIPLLF